MKNTLINETRYDSIDLSHHNLKEKKLITNFDRIGESLNFERAIMHAGGFG